MSQTIFVVDTLMDGFVGFENKIDSEAFKEVLPARQRAITEIYEVQLFSGLQESVRWLRNKHKEPEPELIPV